MLVTQLSIAGLFSFAGSGGCSTHWTMGTKVSLRKASSIPSATEGHSTTGNATLGLPR